MGPPPDGKGTSTAVDAIGQAVLFVDLDGTLIRSDTLVESTLTLLRQRPWLLFMLPVWLLRGRAELKAEVARRVELDVAKLPYNDELLTYLRGESMDGRDLVLATAADQRIADRVAAHLGIFSSVIASQDGHNRKGSAKLAAIRDAVGDRPFDYAGDSSADLAIWKHARRGIVVSSSRRLLDQAREGTELERVFEGPSLTLRTLLRAIRVHQWVKNVLVFLPIILAHRIEPELLVSGLAAFFAMSFLASMVYLINDLVDLESDRQHPTKRHRPLAAGSLPVTVAVALMPVLLATSIGLTTLLPPRLGLVLGGYLVLTTAYSMRLKRVVLVDVLLLAGLYSIRILAGAVATDLPVSEWLLAFSIFIFLSLAFVKRYSELCALRERSGAEASGRGYTVRDIDAVGAMGVASGYLAIRVMALYVTSEKVVALYARPQLLWGVCLLVLFWISRIWLLAYRGEMHEDPVVFAIKDRQSYLIALAAGVTLLLAMGGLVG